MTTSGGCRQPHDQCPESVPAPAIDEDQRAFLEEQRRKAEESISKPSTEKVISPQDKIIFIQDIIKYLNGEINKSQIENSGLLKKLIEIQDKSNQYIIENNGMRKIIEERNEEIKILKEELSK